MRHQFALDQRFQPDDIALINALQGRLIMAGETPNLRATAAWVVSAQASRNAVIQSVSIVIGPICVVLFTMVKGVTGLSVLTPERGARGSDLLLVGVIDAVPSNDGALGAGVVDQPPDGVAQGFSVLLGPFNAEISGLLQGMQVFLKVGFVDVGCRCNIRRAKYLENADGVPCPLPCDGDAVAFGEAANEPGHGFTAPPRTAWSPNAPGR